MDETAETATYSRQDEWGAMLPNFGAGREQDQPAHILLVEDEVLIRTIVAEEIRNSSLCVIEAATADEAWAYLQAGGRADLVFSDIQMPGSMDGLELARRIKVEYPDIKIIITSGNAGPRNAAEVARFLPKPYRIGHAVEMMLESLNLG